MPPCLCHRSTVPPFHWASLPLYQRSTVPPLHCAVVLLCLRATDSFCPFRTVPQYHCAFIPVYPIISPCLCVTDALLFCSTLLLFCCSYLPLRLCFTALLLHYFNHTVTGLLSKCSSLPPFHCNALFFTFVVLFRCSIVTLFFSSVVLLLCSALVPFHCDTVLLCPVSNFPLCYCILVQLVYRFSLYWVAVLLCHCPPMPMLYFSAMAMLHCSIAPTTVPPFNSSTVHFPRCC